MACSGCAQRRAMIADSLRSIRKAEISEAGHLLKAAGSSAAQDLQRLKVKALQAARNRLAGR